MPSQLLENLRRFFDQGSGRAQDQAASTHPLDEIMRHENDPKVDVLVPPVPNAAKPGEPALNHTAHWRAGWGGKMAKNTVAATGANQVSGLNTISIHETTGWPSWEASDNMMRRHLCISESNEWIVNAAEQNGGHWITHETGKKGVGPQYYIDGNGTVFALAGEFDLGAEPRITIHTESVNSTSIGIENGDAGDGGIRPADNASGPYWFRLNPPTAALPGDMPGLAVFALLHPRSNQADLNLIWFCTAASGAAIPDYPGSGDTANIARRYPNWDNMLFTERNYRSLALLVRVLAEQYGVPRNFCVLPYAKVDPDGADREILRKLILADERQEMMARKFGITVADIKNKTHVWMTQNNQTLWLRFFGVRAGVAEFPTYRGFIAHALVGAHPCPGPLFDWHRFAREVWDWWWYPFDLNIFVPALSSPRRAYWQARGDTPLREYYYDAAEPGSDFTTIGDRINALGVQALDEARGENHFSLSASTPVYAMANGVVVAARLSNPADPANPPFVLIRHDVFRRTNAATHAIDYDQAPSFVWSLTTYLNCAGFDFSQITTDNPDWLNRLLMRLKECELAVSFKNAHPGADPNTPQYKGHPALFANDQRYQTAWNFAPTSTGPRPTTGDLIQLDATEYRRIVDGLHAGNSILFPLASTPSPTPVRVVLGDFLGPCGTLPDNSPGMQVQIFAKEPLLPNVDQSALVWVNQNWWATAAAAARLDGTPDKSLPVNGMVYSFPVTAFLDWINLITWTSEWKKYEVVDAHAAPVATPARPQTRNGL